MGMLFKYARSLRLVVILALATLACATLGQAAPTSRPALPPTEVPAAATPAQPPAEATEPPAPAPPAGELPTIAGCTVFPADNIWNVPVDGLPVDANSEAYLQTIGPDVSLHPDFGSGLDNGEPIGIPFVEVAGDQPGVQVTFTYPDESDPGPYPIPADPSIEGGPTSDNDRHVLIVDRDNCVLYEMFYAFPQDDGTWTADSGAVFDLNSNELRPETWTSTDAAGLPVLPGLVRYDEVAAGEIRHAVRFTTPETRDEYVWPARHAASDLTGTEYPPMGQRFRLRGDYDLSGFSPDVQVILRALQTYGMMLADNGSAAHVTGAPDERWNNDVLSELSQVHMADFEAVDVSSLIVDPNSAQAAGAAAPEVDPAQLPPTSAAPLGTGGHVTFTTPDNRVYRVAADGSGDLEDVSQALDGLSEGGNDGWLNISTDGAWLVVVTERFDPDCTGWACLVILPADLSAGEAVRAGDALVHPDGLSAVASGGNLIVYPAGNGPHSRDLWAVTRDGDNWSVPALLTGESSYDYNDVPALSADGSRVVFACGDQPYGGPGTDVCVVGTDGTDYQAIMDAGQSDDGTVTYALHLPAFSPDGGIVFEADWDGQKLWELPAGVGADVRLVNPAFDNDNSPCVLPDGRIVSMWLDRPDSGGLHELKVMSPDGQSYEMLLTGVDVLDVGLGCGA